MVKIVREKIFSIQSALFVEVPTILQKNFKRIRKEKEKSRVVSDSYNRRAERTPRKCFRCGSEDHIISKCPKPHKDNEKWQKKVSFSERGNHAS